MPKLIEIKTNRAKQKWLDQMMRSIASTEPVEGEVKAMRIADYSGLIQPLIPQIEAANKDWALAHRTTTSTYNRSRAAVARAHEAMEKLARMSLQARALMRHRVETEDFKAGLTETFGLKRKPPGSHTSKGWLMVATDLMVGEEEAVSAGHRPMDMPSSTELKTLYDEASAACLAADRADYQHQEAQRALRQISDEVRELVQDTSAYLRYKLRRLQPTEQRRIMRKFGYHYQGETPPEADEAATPTLETPAEAPLDALQVQTPTSPSDDAQSLQVQPIASKALAMPAGVPREDTSQHTSPVKKTPSKYLPPAPLPSKELNPQTSQVGTDHQDVMSMSRGRPPLAMGPPSSSTYNSRE